MKTILAIVLCGFLIAVAGPLQAADVAKIGVIDFQRLLEQSKAGKRAQEQLKGEFEQMRTDLEKRGRELEEIKKQLERDALVMDRARYEEKQRDVRIQINDFKELQKKYTLEWKSKESKHLLRIQEEVMEIVEEMGKKEGYLLVVERQAVVYYPKTIDLTDRIIELYDKQYAQ